MKFAKQYLESIDGIEIYPIISLLIFFTFFVGLFWWVFTTSKQQTKAMSELPLETNPKEKINENDSIIS
jgi:cbb3-type cytochrome oxidase subunit 3